MFLFTAAATFKRLFIPPPLPTEKEPLIFYSPELGDRLQRVAIEFVKSAKESLQVLSYGITDSPLLLAIEKAAKRGVRVELFFDAHQSPERLLTLHPKITLHPIKRSGLMHRKWIIADKKHLLIGSANMTRASLSMHANLMVGIFNESLASHLSLEPLESGKKISFTLHHRECELWLLPDFRDHAFQRILSLFDGDIKKASFGFFTFTHPLLAEKICHIASKGSDVDLFLDRQAGLGASKKVAQRFESFGLKPRFNVGLALLHHKMALLDDCFVMGSTNWTCAAFEKNIDLFLILKLSPKEQKRVKSLWKGLKKRSSFASELLQKEDKC